MREQSSAVVSTAAPLPSPTLTNPDMILPYSSHDYMRAATPSPPPETMRPPSPPLAARALNSHPPFAQLARPPQAKRSASPRVTPPLESYTPGGVLSDIEEVETTPKQRTTKQKMFRQARSRSPPLASSPTLELGSRRQQNEYLSPVPAANRRPSNSGSVNSATSDTSSLQGFENFDDSFSVDGEGSVYPDEDDELSSNAGESSGYHAHNGTGHGGEVGGAQREERENRASHVALSRRAERILASAKKRLDNMEGNLNRARHSLIISPSPSMSTSTANRYSPPYSTTLPTSEELDESPIHPPLGVSPAKHRQLHSAASPSSPGHSRVFSETSVPSSLHSSPNSPYITSRSKSAQGVVGMARSPGDGLSPITSSIPKSRSDEHFRPAAEITPPTSSGLGYGRSLSANHTRSSPGSYSSTIKPVSREGSIKNQGLSNGIGNLPASRSTSSMSNFTNQSSLGRSHSTAQMRDLRDQMKDLKGKISTLQQRAREDGLRRRSLQSLRTPSPFTAAEQWYTAGNGYAEGGLSANAGIGIADGRTKSEVAFANEHDRGLEPEETDGAWRELSQYEDAAQDTHEGERWVDGREHERLYGHANMEGLREEDHELDEDPAPELEEDVSPRIVDRYQSESPVDPGLIPATPVVVGERHEDRADAFDYEHFFLHSGMGNYELPTAGRGSRSASCSSADSASTTRILVATSQPVSEYQQQANGHWRRSGHVQSFAAPNSPIDVDESPKAFPRPYHERQGSNNSISTMATFATAQEGRHSNESSENEDEEHNFGQPNGLQIFTEKALPSLPSDPARNSNRNSSQRDSQAENTDEPDTPTTVRAAQSLPSSPSSVIGPNGKATPTSISSGRSSSSTSSTPRSFPLVNKPRQVFPRPLPSTRALLSPRPGRPGSGGVQGIEGEEGAVKLEKGDRALVEGLVMSLKRACARLNESSAEDKGEWRLRLEEARKLLDGDRSDSRGRR